MKIKCECGEEFPITTERTKFHRRGRQIRCPKCNKRYVLTQWVKKN